MAPTKEDIALSLVDIAYEGADLKGFGVQRQACVGASNCPLSQAPAEFNFSAWKEAKRPKENEHLSEEALGVFARYGREDTVYQCVSSGHRQDRRELIDCSFILAPTSGGTIAQRAHAWRAKDTYYKHYSSNGERLVDTGPSLTPPLSGNASTWHDVQKSAYIDGAAEAIE